jgi:hypothetical protein
MTLRERCWLCLPPLLLSVCDATLTLACQDAAYWRGDASAVREWNPVGRLLLTRHPLAFAAAAAAWSLAVGALILWWRSSLAVVLAFVVTFAHAVAAAAWLARGGLVGVAAAVVLLVLAEGLLSFSWRQAGLTRVEVPS